MRSTSAGQLAAQPSASARDPRLQRKPKSSPLEQDLSPNKKALLPPPPPPNKQGQETLNQTGIKRTSPNSSQNPNEIKKPKYTIASTVN